MAVGQVIGDGAGYAMTIDAQRLRPGVRQQAIQAAPPFAALAVLPGNDGRHVDHAPGHFRLHERRQDGRLAAHGQEQERRPPEIDAEVAPVTRQVIDAVRICDERRVDSITGERAAQPFQPVLMHTAHAASPPAVDP